jgi:VWFA-related protein
MIKKNNPLSTVRQLLLISFISAILTAPIIFAQEHDKIQHEVSVSRVLVPLFAYDKNGNPVYDLKKEDILLTINGKRVEVLTLDRIQFEHDIETTKTIKTKVKRYIAPQPRVVFLVVDTMFNSFYGLKRAKRIVSRLIDKAAPGNQFVIMENSMFGGLKLLLGPESDKTKLKNALKKISRLPDKRSNSDTLDISVRNPYSNRSGNSNLTSKIERRHDKEKVKFFCGFMSKLKYSLETITNPKMVLLVSEGFSEVLFYEANPYIKGLVNYDSMLTDHIKKLVKEINDGGSVLYTIYSGRVKIVKNMGGKSSGSGKGSMDTGSYDFTVEDADLPISSDSGVESLRTIATASGGRLFDDIDERIITQIEKETAAYYIVSCTSPTNNNSMRFRVRSKRKDVRLNSLIKTKTNNQYSRLNKLQKKIFAMNVAMGNSWAVTAGNTTKAFYRWKNENKTKIQVTVPPEMNGRDVDLFLIQFKPEYQDPQIKMKKLKPSDNITFDFTYPKDNMSGYFVLIEPETTRVIFNRLK